MESLERYLLVSAIVLFIFVFYRWLLKFLRRKDLTGNYPYLHPFAKSILSGREVLVFELPNSTRVSAQIRALNGDVVVACFDEEFKSGKHQKQIDTSKAKSGTYELKITFSNQVTTRRIEIEN